MATFKSKMKHLEPDWADQIWRAATQKKAGWRLALAALAVTGVRPASLERGITFRAVQNEAGEHFIEAIAKGAKIIKNDLGEPVRGQDEIVLRWQQSPKKTTSHRIKEFQAISRELLKSESREITISYDAEAISTRLRELSQEIWPRKRFHVSGVCYRELFSAKCKEAGIPPEEIAAAMGHLSAESQGKYSARPRRAKGGVEPEIPAEAMKQYQAINALLGGAQAPDVKPFSSASATSPVRKIDKAPANSIAGFRAAGAKKKAMKAAANKP